MKLVTALGAILALGCFQSSLALTEKETKLVAANNDFAVRLLKVLPSRPDENVFFSPYSLSAALGMTYAGARGATLQQLSEVLGYKAAGLTDADVHDAFANQNNRLQSQGSRAGLEVANSAAVQEGFNVLDTYYAALNHTFNAHVFTVDFEHSPQQAVDTINAWVKQATHGKIDKLFAEPLDTTTRLVLTNGIVFKGLWARQFRPELTQKRPFYNGGTQPTQVDMMFQRLEANRAFSEELQANILELPYREGDYSMLIVLPTERDGVEALKQVLTIGKIEAAVASLRNLTAAVSLPKFEVDKLNPLKEKLTDLGLEKMFGDADLSGITGNRNLVVSDVIQRAVVKVDEEGTEAAAATGVVSVNRIGSEPFRFTADHPFLFFIRNTVTHEIFFAGQLNKL